jgi:hypothetical protein
LTRLRGRSPFGEAKARASIHLRKILLKRLDCRVKPDDNDVDARRRASRFCPAMTRMGLGAAHPTRKIPPSGGTFLLSLALTEFWSELAILLTLLALTALAIRILLLLAGLLAAALLLAGLLTRVLILLARILVLIRHSGTPFSRCWEHNAKTTAGPGFGFRKIPVPARSLRGGGLARLWPRNRAKTTRVQPLKPHLLLLPLRVPTVRK